MKKVEETTGKTPPQLQEYYDVPFPIELADYWNDFLELNRRRGHGESGDLPITFVDIDAWCRVTQVSVSQLWLDVIDMLDQAWLSYQAKKQK